LFNIYQRFEAEGAKGLINKPPGRKPGEQRLLTPAQEAEVQALVRRHNPRRAGPALCPLEPGGGAALVAAGLPGDRETRQASPRRRGLG
jgi:hypothetical protein